MPDGDLAAAHASSAGAMNAFRWKIRKEPRWKNIARRRDAQPATLHIHSCPPPNVHSQRPFKKPDNSTNIPTLLTHARSGGAAGAATVLGDGGA